MVPEACIRDASHRQRRRQISGFVDVPDHARVAAGDLHQLTGVALDDFRPPHFGDNR